MLKYAQMAENEHQILGVDLGMINEAGKSVGISFQPENLDQQTGFSPNTEETFDAFSETMNTVERAITSIENLDSHDLFILSVLGYRIK